MKRWCKFFTVVDYIEEEKWLREKSKEGWKFVKMIPPCFYYFEKSDPEDMIYRLDFKWKTKDSSYLAMFEKYGWVHLGSFLEWNYFRKPAGKDTLVNEEKIFLSEENTLDRIQKIVTFKFLPLAFIFLLCIIPNIFMLVKGEIELYSIILLTLFSLLFWTYVVLITYIGRKLVKLKQRK